MRKIQEKITGKVARSLGKKAGEIEDAVDLGNLSKVVEEAISETTEKSIRKAMTNEVTGKMSENIDDMLWGVRDQLSPSNSPMSSLREQIDDIEKFYQELTKGKVAESGGGSGVKIHDSVDMVDEIGEGIRGVEGEVELNFMMI